MVTENVGQLGDGKLYEMCTDDRNAPVEDSMFYDEEGYSSSAVMINNSSSRLSMTIWQLSTFPYYLSTYLSQPIAYLRTCSDSARGREARACVDHVNSSAIHIDVTTMLCLTLLRVTDTHPMSVRQTESNMWSKVCLSPLTKKPS